MAHILERHAATSPRGQYRIKIWDNNHIELDNFNDKRVWTQDFNDKTSGCFPRETYPLKKKNRRMSQFSH